MPEPSAPPAQQRRAPSTPADLELRALWATIANCMEVLEHCARELAALELRLNGLPPEDDDPRLWVMPLTRRERQVLALVARGMTNAQIGQQLGISHRTVANYLTHIRGKLDVRSRYGAVLCARALGLM